MIKIQENALTARRTSPVGIVIHAKMVYMDMIVQKNAAWVAI